MMVTFISQCEKKALNRTRRVLDSFANRIGDNTWQTVITHEGLIAVKKLLRKTASKNTAVSCFWIRSRSRSELVWVVGNKDKFNSEGVVPVNSTKIIDIKTDETNMNIESYYANTKKQLLDQHLFAVGYVSYLLCQQLVDDEKIAQAVFIAGCWHDMGKIDAGFQEWILKKTNKQLIDDIPEEGQHIDTKSDAFSFEKHPRHNEISILLYYLLDDESNTTINKSNKKLIGHSIYWHHAKPIRKEEIKNLDSVYKKIKNKLKEKSLTESTQITRAIVYEINNISEAYELDLRLDGLLKKIDEDKLDDLREQNLPIYKNYGLNEEVNEFTRDIQLNARNNIARTALISADRLISSLGAQELTRHIEERTLHTLVESSLLNERGLKSDIETCLEGFEKKYPNSSRNQQQYTAAQELADEENSVAVLSGPAGCGKTKIALEWAANTQVKKIIWVCPRVQVCQGLIHDLCDNEYLPNTKIEICTGEFKNIYQNGSNTATPEGQEFSGDIVLTTIDQVINTITTHTKITGLVQYMNAHVVFDEYHEYINMPAFNLLFAELVECKKLQNVKANALLVSATPNYHFVKELLNLDNDNVVPFKSFNESKYQIEFITFDDNSEKDNPLYQTQPKNTFVISNTAITAQKSFIKNQQNENAILFHSKFKKSDKQLLFNKVFDNFKRNGTQKLDVLRAGPIVQASLNITCDKMITEFTNAENWLQRLGRLDRFGENNNNIYISAISENVKNGKSLGNAKFLNNMHCLQGAKAWYEFLIAKEVNEKPITLANIYNIYEEYYEDQTCQQAIEQDMVKALKESVELLSEKLMDPVSFPNKNKFKDGKPKIKNNSLRGNNRFVQMAVWNIANSKEEFPNEYAYDENDTKGNLTQAVETICGHGSSEKDLLAFMAKKHHNIKDNIKKTYKDNMLLAEARAPETPIYLSYTPSDLKQVEAQPHSYAIYYAIGKNQPIGSLSIHQINKTGEEE